MGSYSESTPVSKANSTVFKQKKDPVVKPGSLPWEEESMTYSRDKGALLIKLQRENAELRKKLKEFNSSLNEIISALGQKKPKHKQTPMDPTKSLKTANQKIANYEKEYARLENRHQTLRDPNYESSLKNEVLLLKQKVQELENHKKKREAKQKLREKEFDTIIETGEKAEHHREFFEINTEINSYTQKLQKLRELNERTTQAYTDVEGKLKTLEREYKELSGNRELPKEVEISKNYQESFQKVKKKQGAIEGKYDSNCKLLSQKIKKIEEELSASRRTENEIMESLSRKNEEYRVHQLSLNDLQIRAVSNTYKKKPVHESSFTEDYIFTTEKQY